jgi:hypothetical protein
MENIMSATAITSRYAEAALEREFAKISTTPTGDRNGSLYRGTASVAGLIPSGAISESEVRSTMESAAHANGSTRDDGAVAVRKTIESGIKKGMSNPRDVVVASRGASIAPFPTAEILTFPPGGQVATNPKDAVAPAEIPLWAPVAEDGTSIKFIAGDELPPQGDELRRHVYRHNGRPHGEPVLIKVKKHDGRWSQLYRVRNENGENGWQPKKPAVYAAVPYTGALDPFCSNHESGFIGWPEGERDVDTLDHHGIAALTFGSASVVPQGSEEWVVGANVVIFADYDKAGLDHAEKKAIRCGSRTASVKIVSFPEMGTGGDVTDWFEAGHDMTELLARVAEAPIWEPPLMVPGAASGSIWPDPTPLPSGLAPVDAFDLDFLPSTIAPWVGDIADRMQCPADFVGVSAVVGLGTVIGRRVGVRPQKQTDWVEVANMWACIIARPGAMKSPAMTEALKPLRWLESEAQKENDAAQYAYALEAEAFDLRKDLATIAAKAAIKQGGDPISILNIVAPQEPLPRRYLTNDTTYEKLGEILAANPNGILAFRDELVSLLKTLDREENAATRGFFLSAWNGTSGYTFDRIIRGTTHIDAACLSLLGSTQPGRIAEYIRRAHSGGAGDDGLIQRMGLVVWPDPVAKWKDVDRFPDSTARKAAFDTFEWLNQLRPEDVGAEQDEFDTVPFLRFDDAAQAAFLQWRTELERRLITHELHPAFESHLAKYRSLVPGLALINHLADFGSGPIDEAALQRALAYAAYLESHARRVYGAGSQAETAAAEAIRTRIKNGDLADGFSARDIYRREWSNLSDRAQVQAGVDLLVDFDWIAAEELKTAGKSKTIYRINPKVLR